MRIPIESALIGSMILDGVIIILLIWFYIAAERSFYRLTYLSPTQYRALAALADVVVAGKTEIITAEEVARNVDDYLSRFKAQSKWIIRIVLLGIEAYPLLSFKPPLSHLNPEDRRAFLMKRFYQDVTLRLVPEFWRTIVQGMIRMGKQLSYLGYYNDKRTYPSVGYIPFSERPDTPGKLAATAEKLRKHELPEPMPLVVQTYSDVTSEA